MYSAMFLYMIYINMTSISIFTFFFTVGFMLCYQYLQEANAWDLWKQVLQAGYIIQLCRDEVIHIHGYIVAFFETIKG
jgi:NCK-associated protein 1